MKRTVVIIVFVCSLFITITMLGFYRTATSRGNGEHAHITLPTGYRVLNISRMALPAHFIPERIDFCNNRGATNIFCDVGSNRGDVLHAFLYKKHLRNSNNPDWKFAEVYDPATYNVYGLKLFHHSLNH